jgi:hypothetical protein
LKRAEGSNGGGDHSNWAVGGSARVLSWVSFINGT